MAIRRFLHNATLFLTGLLVLVLEGRIGRQIRSNHGYFNGDPIDGREIYRAQELADEPGRRPRARVV